MTASFQPGPYRQGPPRLTFAPLAWLKLQFFCHFGDTEIGGFGITSQDDLLYVEDFVTVRQHTSMVTVSMDDQAVADFMDDCTDAGLPPQRFLRLWCHTHPGTLAQPSQTDEDTFARVFGSCDWAVMFIVSRTSVTYARLSFHVGPGAEMQLPVAVNWRSWPTILTDPDFAMMDQLAAWQREYATNIHGIPASLPMLLTNLDSLPPNVGPSGPLLSDWDWDDFDQKYLEEFERHERSLDRDFRS